MRVFTSILLLVAMVFIVAACVGGGDVGKQIHPFAISKFPREIRYDDGKFLILCTIDKVGDGMYLLSGDAEFKEASRVGKWETFDLNALLTQDKSVVETVHIFTYPDDRTKHISFNHKFKSDSTFNGMNFKYNYKYRN